MQALGLVETRGLVGAVEGADAMLKAADVRLLEKSLAGGGLVTITVTGSVSAVQVSVDAACAAIERIPGTSLVSSHVIPRPDDQLYAILKLDPEPEPTLGTPGRKAPAKETPAGAPKAEPKDKPTDEPTPALRPVPNVAPAGSVSKPSAGAASKPVDGSRPRPRVAKADARPAAAPKASGSPAPAAGESRTGWTEEELKAMSLGNLRALARRENIDLNGKGLAKGLAQASKKALVQALLKAGERSKG